MQQHNSNQVDVEALRKRYHADAVPFYDENYTFADRNRDLALMETLLTEKLVNVRMEQSLLRHSIATGSYIPSHDAQAEQTDRSTTTLPTSGVSSEQEELES